MADTAVQESLLAVPFALGKARRVPPVDSRVDERALDAYTREIARPMRRSRRFVAGPLVENLLRDTRRESGWFWRVRQRRIRRRAATSRSCWRVRFSEGLKNYRDLVSCCAICNTWAQSIGTYRDMLATRRRGLPNDCRVLCRRARSPGRATADRPRARVQGLARIESEGDAEALAAERKHARHRLERVARGLSVCRSGAARTARRSTVCCALAHMGSVGQSARVCGVRTRRCRSGSVDCRGRSAT